MLISVDQEYSLYRVEVEVASPHMFWSGDMLWNPASQPYQEMKQDFENQVGSFPWRHSVYELQHVQPMVQWVFKSLLFMFLLCVFMPPVKNSTFIH